MPKYWSFSNKDETTALLIPTLFYLCLAETFDPPLPLPEKSEIVQMLPLDAQE